MWETALHLFTEQQRQQQLGGFPHKFVPWNLVDSTSNSAIDKPLIQGDEDLLAERRQVKTGKMTETHVGVIEALKIKQF